MSTFIGSDPFGKPIRAKPDSASVILNLICILVFVILLAAFIVVEAFRLRSAPPVLTLEHVDAWAAAPPSGLQTEVDPDSIYILGFSFVFPSPQTPSLGYFQTPLGVPPFPAGPAPVLTSMESELHSRLVSNNDERKTILPYFQPQFISKLKPIDLTYPTAIQQYLSVFDPRRGSVFAMSAEVNTSDPVGFPDLVITAYGDVSSVAPGYEQLTSFIFQWEVTPQTLTNLYMELNVIHHADGTITKYPKIDYIDVEALGKGQKTSSQLIIHPSRFFTRDIYAYPNLYLNLLSSIGGASTVLIFVLGLIVSIFGTHLKKGVAVACCEQRCGKGIANTIKTKWKPANPIEPRDEDEENMKLLEEQK